MIDSFDAAIVGGGPAGAAAALALARGGRRAVVIEASAYGGFRVGETVPAGLRAVLRDLGAWETFAAAGHLPSAGNASAWGSGDLGVRDSLFDVQGSGWHLDRARFDADLAAEAERAGAFIRTRTRLTGCARQGHGWSLDLQTPDGPRRINAPFLIDATGRAAFVARRCGARRLHRDRLVAAFAVFAWPEEPGHLHTLVEAAEDGWWYAARLPDDQAMVSWMSDSDLVHRAGLHQRGPWTEKLGRTRYVREMLAGASLHSDVAVRSAASHGLDRAAGEGWLAVGDAASAFDPLTSAGIVAGLRSGLEAATAVDRCLGGDGAALDSYDGRLRTRFHQYLQGRREQYAREGRWPESPFWRRRSAAPADSTH
ncbi:MAG: FAD-dependent monooxygenase [Thermoanaerobaculia bacterium]